MDAPIIDMHGIVKRFPIGTGEELEVLHGIDLTVRKGEFVAIVGASGSGKSTLMNIIGALDRPTEGTYVLDGVDVGTLRDKQLSRIRCRKIGFVFQTFNLVPRTSALKNVALPMMYNGVRGAARTQRARAPAQRTSGCPQHNRCQQGKTIRVHGISKPLFMPRPSRADLRRTPGGTHFSKYNVF